jgi:hypothetical protein
MRLSENAHLPFDKLMALSKTEGPFGKLTALSKVEGLRYPHPSSLRRTSLYASFLGISEALHMDIFHQPLSTRFFDSLYNIRQYLILFSVKFINRTIP